MRKPLIIVGLALGLLITISLIVAYGTRFGQAYFASLDRFSRLPGTNGVFAEEGAEVMAAHLAGVLPSAVARVEKVQGAPFKGSVRVYMCSTQECFNHHIPIGANASGAVFRNRVFMSPRAFELESAGPILTHELSHLHLRQYTGSIGFTAKLPGWFQEGLAVAVSEGGGAVQVDPSVAVDAIRSGRTFTPEDDGTWFRPRMAREHRLQHHMFYRQSGMFVTWLMERDEAAWQRFITDIRLGRSFAKSVTELGGSVEELWDTFKDSLGGMSF